MDHFKEYNDSLGHLTGDQILKDFADSLQQDDDRIISCRFGGDEFICICVDCNEQMIISFIEQVYSNLSYMGMIKSLFHLDIIILLVIVYLKRN